MLLFTFHPEAGGRHQLISISMSLNNDGEGGRSHTDWAVRSHLALLVKGRGEEVLSQELSLFIFNHTQAHWLVLPTSTQSFRVVAHTRHSPSGVASVMS